MTQTPTLFIGVDGGGTGCRVVIADCEGNVIATARGGAANFTSDPARTVENVLAALNDAAKTAGFTQDALKTASAHLGLAGIVSPKDAKAVAQRMPFARYAITDDRPTSVAGALGDRNGAVIAVGTGSFIAMKRGRDIRATGGWGLQLGDQASGAWLGQHILKRCAMVKDGLAETSELVERLWVKFGNDPSTLIAFARRASPADLSELGPDVLTSAENGDQNAMSIVREAADYLNLCLTSLDLKDEDVVCLTGGLAPLYRPWLAASFQVRIAEPRGTALDGALLLARETGQAAASSGQK
jgi:glucosamine kinase